MVLPFNGALALCSRQLSAIEMINRTPLLNKETASRASIRSALFDRIFQLFETASCRMNSLF